MVAKRPASRSLTLKRPAAAEPSPEPVLKRPAAATQKAEPSAPKTLEEGKKTACHVEGGEEETKEDDPIVEEESGKPGSKPGVTKKKPAAVLPTSASPAPKRGQVVQTIQKPNGWQLVQIQTPSGRQYWKWISKDGLYYFSKVQAGAHGFKDS